MYSRTDFVQHVIRRAVLQFDSACFLYPLCMSTLRIQYQHLRIQYQHLWIQYQHLWIQYQHLRIQYQHLWIQYQHLRIQYQHLRIQYQHLWILYQHLYCMGWRGRFATCGTQSGVSDVVVPFTRGRRETQGHRASCLKSLLINLVCWLAA